MATADMAADLALALDPALLMERALADAGLFGRRADRRLRQQGDERFILFRVQRCHFMPSPADLLFQSLIAVLT